MLTNLMKRTLSFVLALILVVSVLPLQTFATETEHSHDETDTVATESEHNHDESVQTEPEATEPEADNTEQLDENTMPVTLAAGPVTVTYDSALGVVKSDAADVASGTTASGTLIAAAKSGSVFLGWISTANNKILSTSATYTPGENVTAVFASATSNAWFRVDGAYLFADLNAAAAAGTKIVLAADGTLAAGEYTIPAGDTLLIPFDAAETCYDATNIPAWVTERVQPVAYRTLTMADGAKITVNGVMSLSAKHHVITSSAPYGGSPNGSCSFVNMNSGSNITVNGQLHAYGFITGSGSVTINSTGAVYENFQVTDFRGGTATLQMADDTAQHGYGVFPLSQYYIQNVEVPMSLYAGAKEYSVTTIYMSSMGFTSSVPFISGVGSGSMFEMESGYVTKCYDGTRDRLVLEANNAKVSISPIGMQISEAASLNSKQFTLPINNNFTVQINAGSEVAIKQDVALLPGSEIIVKKGATCTMNGVSAYVYDQDQWGGHCGSANLPFEPLEYVPGRTGTRTGLTDAKVVIEGQMSAQSGALYTTAGGAAISGVEGAIINVDVSKNTKTVTYQATQHDRAISYVNIPITAVKLLNADGSYTETAKESGYYKYANGRWHLPSCGGNTKATVTKAATCTATGMQTISCGCGISYEEVIPMTAHKEKRVSAVAASCTETGLTEGVQCETCGHWVKEQEETAALGHAWGNITVDYAPTCGYEGRNSGTCTRCFITEYYTVEKLPHTETVQERNRTEASCTLAGGYTKLTMCTVCGEYSVENVEIPAKGHTYVTTEVVAPSCTEEGYTSKRCYDCGDVIQDDKVAPSGHTWDEGTITTPVGCTTEGVVAFTCTACNETKTEFLQPEGHKEKTIPAKNPTCTETGLTEGVQCETCGHWIKAQEEAPALGHSYNNGEITAPPSCTGEGVKTYTCSVCGGTKTDPVAATGHTEKTVSGYAATCDKAGLTDGVVCSVCDATIKAQETIPATGNHSWDDGKITTAPTCTGTGVKTYTCSVCGGTKTEPIAANGHNEETIPAVPATCTKTGLTEGIKCSVCDTVLKAQTETAMTEHTPGAPVEEDREEATCTAKGSYDLVTYCTAKDCGRELKRETKEIELADHIPGDAATCTEAQTCTICSVVLEEALGHDYDSKVTTEPTCTETGVKTFTCKNDKNHTYTEEIPALGHTSKTGAAKEPTCTETGLTAASVCEVCDAVIVAGEEIPALGHDEIETETEAATCTETGMVTITCSRCDFVLKKSTAALGHTEKTLEAVKATCTATGLTSGKQCTVCQKVTVEQTEIPKLPHKEVTEAGYAATCEIDGLTDGKYCTVCGNTTVEQTVIKAEGHKDNDGIVTTEATCTSKGVKTYSCTVCLKVTKTEEVAEKPHTEKTVSGYAATCDKAGLTDGVVCSVCDATIKAQETIPATGEHSWDEGKITTAPTCTGTGVKTYSCTTCTTAKKTETVAATGHTEKTVSGYAATCVKTGLTDGVACSVCNATITSQQTIPVIPHTPGEAVKENEKAAACTVAGSHDLVTYCTVCDKELSRETKAVAALGHTNETVKGYAATCTKTGKTDGTKCSVCNVTTKEQEVIPMAEHTPSEVAIENKIDPTCDVGGSFDEVTYCTECDKELTRKRTHTDALGHTEVILEAVAPTCTETGLTEGKKCSVCDQVLVAQKAVGSQGHTVEIDDPVNPTCTETGLTEGRHCSVCDQVLVAQKVVPATGHTEVTLEAVAPTCTETGLTEGKHCSECDEILVAQKEVPMVEHTWGSGSVTKEPTCTADGVRSFVCEVCLAAKEEAEKALGHDMVPVEAKVPTYLTAGYDAYEKCTRCTYNTKVEIPAVEKPVLDTYEEFLENLIVLEQITAEYVETYPGKDPLALMIKYIRTGVDRYNDGSWNIMAGYEDPDFAKYVQNYEVNYNNQAASVDDLICVTILKDIEFFNLPNGDFVDFGHMFGTMDITYHNSGSQNHADVAGWAGDLVDLLDVSSRHDVSGTLNEMIAEVASDYLASTDLSEEDIFSLKDMYGDMDGFYLIEMLTAQDYTTGMFSDIVKNYFTAELTDEARAEFFLQHRLDGVTSRTGLREKVYSEYTGNSMIPTLEATREFKNTSVLPDLRKACCYAFADYMCKLAGDYTEVNGNDYYTVFDTKTSTLAPGITQEINKATTADNKQIVYYIATADVNNPYVSVYANYKSRDPYNESTGEYEWGMSRVRDQVHAAEAVFTDPNSDKYIPNFTPIAGINGSGYNMSTGKPSGLLIMDGVEYHPIDGNGFFGILKDGSAYIGTTAEYYEMKDQIQEGIAGFGSTLVEDGKISISASSNYYTSRASRTAVGITRTGKVVFMVLDGRQEPVSCGGSMEEIAQIMLEAGCVTAINLDGGGSTTYVAQQAGDDDISLVNKPSDGFERSVSTSLMMASTAPSSTEFDHAVLSSEVDYLTVGAQIQVTAAGVSPMGNSVDLPEGLTWAVGDESIGSIDAEGVFTAKKNGTVQIQLKKDGATVGTKNLNVVTPDRLYFSKDNIAMLYGDTITLPIVALYNNKTVKMVGSDLVYELSNSIAGKAEGFTFTAAETNLTSVKLTAKLAAKETVSAMVTISMFERGEGYFDFETEATGGDRQLAWNRVVSNSNTVDNQTYTAIDSNKPMEVSYRFAIDMTQIPIPERLSELIYMLPGADVEGANSAWSFLCQLAERISPLTQVKAVVHVDPNFDVDYSDVKLVNDYFELTDTAFDPATNTLTVTLNFIDQTKAIDVDTANALCILSGVSITPKEDAAWDAKNRLTPVIDGEISYKVYMRTSALYTFSSNPANQEKYGLYDYINPDDSYDRGGCFGSVYNTFTDTFVLINGLEGWTPEGNGYAYYEDGQKYTGIRKIDGYYYNFGDEGVCVGQTMYTGMLQIDGKNHYCRNGLLVSGWVSIDGEKYCFDENGVGYDGEVTIDGIKIQFENGLMVGGQTGFVKKADGNTYYYQDGNMIYGWLQLGDDWYHFNTENGIMTVGDGTAATKLFPDNEAKAKGAYYVFDKDGRALYGFPNKFGYYYWASQPVRQQWVRNGNDLDGWYYTNEYGHFATTPDTTKHFPVTVDGKTYTAFKIPVDENGDGKPDVEYVLDNDSGKLLKGFMVYENGKWFYYWAGETLKDGWFEYEDKAYYANKNGTLATGSVIIDGESYMFTPQGALVTEGAIIKASFNEGNTVMNIRVINADEKMTAARMAIWAATAGQASTLQWIDLEQVDGDTWKADVALCSFDLEQADTFELHVYGTVEGVEGLIVNTAVADVAPAEHTFTNEKDATCNNCGYEREVAEEPEKPEDVATTPMYRLFNPNSGEHFYTGSIEERDNLVEAGWNYEGIAWNAPIYKGIPVYRVFNPNSGDHHYTMSQEEVDMLVALGWIYEGVAWNSAEPDNVPQFRLYNPNADIGSHHYTSSTEERDFLVSLGWHFEGIGWFGIA